MKSEAEIGEVVATLQREIDQLEQEQERTNYYHQAEKWDELEAKIESRRNRLNALLWVLGERPLL